MGRAVAMSLLWNEHCVEHYQREQDRVGLAGKVWK